jgi:trehalose 6-phosphate phosphatase
MTDDTHDWAAAADLDAAIGRLRGELPRLLLAPGARDVLDALVERGVQVAIVTGRDARTVLVLSELSSLPGLVVAGLYGAETWVDGQLTTLDTPPPIIRLRRFLPELIAADSPLWIEDKRLSLVVHGRRAPDPRAALAAVEPGVRALAESLDLEVHPGRDVLELRVPGYDKGRAVRELLARTGREALLYAGDDLGDLPAFEVVRRRRADGHPAWAVGVGSDEVAQLREQVDYMVPDADSFVALLRRLTDSSAPDQAPSESS